MSYPSEQDPLLPGDKRSPEIHGSRPESFSDEYLKEELIDDEQPKSSTSSNFAPMILGLCILSCLFLIFMPSEIPGDDRPAPKTIHQRVNRILEDTPLIDGHNDLAIFIRAYYNNAIYGDDFKKPFEEGGMRAQVDIPRLREGKNGGAFWSAFVPCPTNGSDFSDDNYAASVAFTYTQIDLLTRLQAAYPETFSPPPKARTALSFFKAGQLISPFGIEGLHQIGNSLSNLRNFYALGARYSTLTHNCHNAYADAALLELPSGGVEIAKPKWNGVSPAGRDLIFEMNRMGMIVDLSHVSANTMRDVLGGSKDWHGSLAPIMFSHSSAYAICPHPRNVPDDILHLVKKKNSIVMVNFSPDFVSCVANSTNPTGMPDFYPKNSTLAHVVDHIVYIGDLIGYDHVGLGSDFDGIPTTPEGLDDVSKFPDLVAEMLRRGVSDKDAGKVVGGNILRVWSDADAVASKMQKKGVKPVEDKLPSLW
ncbi:hypothetical protein VTL71DRAFT_14883 [Oculimacula yallundae]|uniref:Dipeptidase n=1 Tax=Oculimacula yallundae TaxID=86028 RepID=A0ABR4CF14_9HELO